MSNDKSQIEKVRHSLSHILTAVIQERFPQAGLGVGPAIDNGFYQDYALPEKLSDEDLPKLDKRMKEMVKKKLEFSRETMTKAKALEFYKNDPYKTELINEHYQNDNDEVQFYRIGTSTQLCEGGHVTNTSDIDPKSFTLQSVAGAYWRGDEKKDMLTRIYGLSFETPEKLEAYLKMIKEAKERDHRKLGKQLDLFTFSELVGAGLPLWTPKGTMVRTLLDNFVWELRKPYGYEHVTIPHITKKELYETSGHWDKFQNDLFKIVSREEHLFAMKPMNCPHHTQIFKRKIHSYREMPQRYGETTMCYRDEQSGELNGLSRVLAFTQDDAHVFCRKNQAKDEAKKIWNIIEAFYGVFGFKLCVRLSLSDPAKPDNYLGDRQLWEYAEQQLREVIQERHENCAEAVGEAAFYGPKIDFMATDAIGREWQVATIQLDLNMPGRFDLFCINEKGEQERIVMIHAAIMGSIERFTSVMLEHLNGELPVWLAPVQIKLLTVNDNHFEHCQKMAKRLTDKGLRVDIDSTAESIGKKIRNSAAEKIPYVLVVGDKEISSGELAVRVRGQADLLHIAENDFIEKTLSKISSRAIEL